MTSLIDEYRRLAIRYGHSIEQGDTEGMDTSTECSQKTFRAIVDAREGNALFLLFSDVSPWVQLQAASHCLELDSARASAKLDELERAGIPHVSTDAKYTLEGWNSGELRFLKP